MFRVFTWKYSIFSHFASCFAIIGIYMPQIMIEITVVLVLRVDLGLTLTFLVEFLYLQSN